MSDTLSSSHPAAPSPASVTIDIATLPAGAIIEFLGGVRPLAKKLDLAASTVQGWKLRDHIPESYHHRLKNLLQEADMDPTQFDGGADSALAPDVADEPVRPTPTRPLPSNPNAAYYAMPQSTLRYWIMSSMTSLGVLALVTLILLTVFFGHDFFDYLTAEREVAALAPPVSAPPMPAETARPGDGTTDDAASDLAQSRAALDQTLDSVKQIKQNAGPDQRDLVGQIDRIETVVTGLRDRVDAMDKTLQDKGVDTGAIRQEINDLSRRDVLAAALLLGVAQVHGMLDQQANFSHDLAFLKALLSNDPAMVASLDKLAPFAEKGLMTREQMTDTLNMVGRETMKISLDRPDLTWSQKLWAAVNRVVEIRRKAPEPTLTADGKRYDTSTPQGQVAQAKSYIENDEFALAAQILQAYQGPGAAEVMQVAQNLDGRNAANAILDSLLQKSQSLLNVDQLKRFLTPDAAPAASP